MSTCKVCGQARSAFIMNNKSVCMECDELLFDMEIECDDELQTQGGKAGQKKEILRKPAPTIKK